MFKRWVGLAGLAALVVMPVAAQDDANTITVVAHDSFNYTEAVMAEFTAQTGITVEVVRAGDAGVLATQAVITKDAPLGDVLYGVDNTFLTRTLDGEIFIPYESPLLETVDDAFKVDPEFRVTPIDYGDVCLNYDAVYFAENDLAVPETLQDLTDPAYRGLLVVENAATSSPGMAFLLATIGVFGEESDYTYLDYWADLVENDVLVVEDWTTAYFSEFSGSAGSAGSEGDRPLVVSYASSPPVEVFYMEEPPETAPTGVIAAPGTCFRQIEFAGILAGTDNEAGAQQFIDFLLSKEFQEDMPLNMFVYPVNGEAELPEIFVEYSQVAEEPVDVPFDAIGEFRETWLDAWTETVLR